MPATILRSLRRYFQHHEWKYFPTGKLSFSILEYYPKEARKHWNDGKRQCLEDCLQAIVECLKQYPELAAQQIEKRDRESAERNRQWHEAYLRRSAPERLEKMKEDLKNEIEIQSQSWEKATAIRAYLAACEVAMRGNQGELNAGGWEKRWLNWGQDWVKSFDPLTVEALEKLKGQFEELEKLNTFVASLRVEEVGEAV